MLEILDTDLENHIIEQSSQPEFKNKLTVGYLKTLVEIEIVDESGNTIDNTLTCNTTKEFLCEVFWTVPKNTLPGTYTATIDDAKNSRQVTFDVIPN